MPHWFALSRRLLQGDESFDFGVPADHFLRQLRHGRMIPDVLPSRQRLNRTFQEVKCALSVHRLLTRLCMQLERLSQSTDRMRVVTRLLQGQPASKHPLQLPRPSVEYQRYASILGVSTHRMQHVADCYDERMRRITWAVMRCITCAAHGLW
jgi:hypothetical protein